MKEEWRRVVGSDRHEVSNTGKLRTIEYKSRNIFGEYTMRPRPVKGNRTKSGYMRVYLYLPNGRRNVFLHVLVLEAFRGPRPKGYVSRHLDGNPENNSLDNLVWGTYEENTADMKRHGTVILGEKCLAAKLTGTQVLAIVDEKKTGKMNTEIAKNYPVTPQNIGDIVRGNTWAWLTGIKREGE